MSEEYDIIINRLLKEISSKAVKVYEAKKLLDRERKQNKILWEAIEHNILDEEIVHSILEELAGVDLPKTFEAKIKRK